MTMVAISYVCHVIVTVQSAQDQMWINVQVV